MKLLADENIPAASVRRLRDLGFDVTYISEISPQIEDAAILALCCKEERILITFDRDFGKLIYVDLLPVPEAVIYLRMRSSFPEEPAMILQNFLEQHQGAFDNYFIILDRKRFRRKPLPRG